jgi:hypothetical protein
MNTTIPISEYPIGNYAVLTSFAVFSAKSLSTDSKVTIKNGYHGSFTGAVTGVFDASGINTGLRNYNGTANDDVFNVAQFIPSPYIVNYTGTPPNVQFNGLSGGSYTFHSGIFYTGNIRPMICTNTTLKFELSGNNTQFFIGGDNYTSPNNAPLPYAKNTNVGFSNVRMQLGAGVNISNIFIWGNVIDIRNSPLLYGNFISNLKSSFTNTPVINGNIWSNGSIVLKGGGLINGNGKLIPHISLGNYTKLFSYNIFAQKTLSTDVSVNVVNGYFGSYQNAYTNRQLFIPSGSPNGAINGTNPSNQQAFYELSNLTTFSVGTGYRNFPIITIDNLAKKFTLEPYTCYFGNNISLTDASFVFNAYGDPSSQFLIVSDQGNVGSSGDINLTNVTMDLSNGAQGYNIFWFANNNINLNNCPKIYGNFTSYKNINFTNTSLVNGRAWSVNYNSNISFTGTKTIIVIQCYMKGTKILTEYGYVAIEQLKKGDNVVVHGKIENNKDVFLDDMLILEPIVWIGKSFISQAALYDDSAPICVKANAFGEDGPFEDLYLSQGHRIIHEGKMLLVKDLINGETIYLDKEIQSIEYYHFELASHSVVIANGITAETYLDFNHHDFFQTL